MILLLLLLPKNITIKRHILLERLYNRFRVFELDHYAFLPISISELQSKMWTIKLILVFVDQTT